VWQFKPIIPTTQDVEVEGSVFGDHFQRIINETIFQTEYSNKRAGSGSSGIDTS
jgi:hypothetical protein